MKKKKLFVKSIFFLGTIFILFFLFNKGKFKVLDSSKQEINLKRNLSPSLTKISKQTPFISQMIEAKKEQSIFIPSWTIDEIEPEKIKEYCPLIYFGTKEKVDDFLSLTENDFFCQDRYYTLKVEEIREKENWSNQLADLANFLKEKQFTGWVLDLEISGLLSSQSQEKINRMVETFYQQGKKVNFKSYIALYGDFFYLKRGYDLPFFVENSDGIMVMAYDFSKSYGQPGPNFPFSGREKYGYDFQTMIDDFLQFVSKEKLTVIFGMYGYDWQVDEKERPLNQAKPLTLNQIREKFLSSSMQHFDNDRSKNVAKEFECVIDNCIIKRDQMAKEVEINYIITSDQPDENGVYRIDYHIVWFEDEESVKIKKDYLKQRGINKISFWAITYF